MENLTHSLIGAALAGATVPTDASPAQRRAFFITGILAANLPDADLLYTRITPPPLGYLLHHRGHTHTIVGLVGIAALIGIVTRLPSIRRAIGGATRPFWLLVTTALASHLVADAWNSYGVHPFFPVSNRWFYGDAIYILEPWLWTLLGVAAVSNTRNSRGRWMLAALLVVLPFVGAAIGMFAWPAVVALAVVATAATLAFRPLHERQRALASLAAAACFVVLSFGLRSAATDRINSADPAAAARTIDLVLNPRPANPLCWEAMRLTRDDDSVMTVSRATVALPSTASRTCGRDSSLDWTPVARQSIGQLRQTARENCAVRAWLQFGRAPAIEAGVIADLRFGSATRGNFSAMRIEDRYAETCPPNLTDWTPPRRDLLDD